jgi:hypothetical protein
MKKILELSYQEAKSFFLEEKSYCSIDMPPYFHFQHLLEKIDGIIANKKTSDFYCEDKKPEHSDNVNHVILNNKDGKYNWRPLEIIHPVLYIELTNVITSEKSWKFIQERFDKFSSIVNITCLSIPIISEKESISNKAVSVKRWWEEIEQKSIELGLEYNNIIHTDITNCYGSFYTHSIPWSLHGREYAKENRMNKNILGNKIDKSIRSMRNGQTNGIPQGSVLMDFIAEIILGYCDEILHEEIEKQNISTYKILRYRDDYKIFTKNKEESHLILKCLSETLSSFGLQLNYTKTVSSNDIISYSLKPDKHYWISHKLYSTNLQQQLFIIHTLAEKFPNSGILNKELMHIFDRVSNTNGTHKDILVLVSILVDIMIKNPRTYPLATAILSYWIHAIIDVNKRWDLMVKILNKFKDIPNTGYFEIWMQRVTKDLNSSIKYTEKLCNLCTSDSEPIWNSEWLNSSIRNLISSYPIMNQKTYDKIDPIIQREEVELFSLNYPDNQILTSDTSDYL